VPGKGSQPADADEAFAHAPYTLVERPIDLQASLMPEVVAVMSGSAPHRRQGDGESRRGR
jgi:hypothetical protein